MAVEGDSPFKRWEFAEAEILLATIFNDLNYKHIQNEYAIVVEKKLLLAYDPTSPDTFKFEHEFYRGYMAALRYLLATSDEAKTAMMAELQAAAEQNNQER